jgi:hypothetical protein
LNVLLLPFDHVEVDEVVGGCHDEAVSMLSLAVALAREAKRDESRCRVWPEGIQEVFPLANLLIVDKKLCSFIMLMHK